VRSPDVSQMFKTSRLGSFIVGPMNDMNTTTGDRTARTDSADIAVLDGVLAKTGDLLAGVRPDQRSLPTPCSDYDVGALMDHIVGWAQVFAAGSNQKEFPEDPAGYHCGDDPAAEFRLAAADIVEGWSTHGLDRTVKVTSGDSPGEMVFTMTLMEYLTHGWDLAVATGQPVPFSDTEAEVTLRRADGMLPDEYRGAGMPFGEVVAVPGDAPAVERLVGYLGRDPQR
jgi:uncharacterized protein (TIGR03086 family)